MKTFKIALIALVSSLLFSCDNNDDGFYNSEFVTIPGLVSIDTPVAPYVVNDFIYINSNFDRLQTQQNQTTLLDLRKSTGNADRFNFTFQIEKKVGNEWQFVSPAANEIDLQDGEIFSGGFFSANSVFDSTPTMDKYKFRAGIKLTSAGQYRLSFGYNSSSVSAVELRSQSSGNNIFLNITSSTTNSLDGNGYYNFVVN